MRTARATALLFARAGAPVVGLQPAAVCAPRGRLNTRAQLSAYLANRKVSPATLAAVVPEIDAGVTRKGDLLWLAGILEVSNKPGKPKGVPRREVILEGWPTIRDWILTTRTKLAGKSWTTALKAAEDWHKKLEATAGQRTNKSRSVVADLGDGWAIVEVPPSDYTAEGKEMGICLRTGHTYGRKGYQTFSLRGPDNASHATMTIAPPGSVKGAPKAPVIIEIKGKKNRLPNARYRQLVMRWLRTQPWGVPFRINNASNAQSWAAQDALGFAWALPDAKQKNNQFSAWGRVFYGKKAPRGAVKVDKSGWVQLAPPGFVDGLLEFLDPIDVAYLLGAGKPEQVRAIFPELLDKHPELIGGALLGLPLKQRLPWLDHSDPQVAASAAWAVQRWVEAMTPSLQDVYELQAVLDRKGIQDGAREAAIKWANAEQDLSVLQEGLARREPLISRAAGVGVDAWFQRLHAKWADRPFGYFKNVALEARDTLSVLPVNARSARVLAKSPSLVDRIAATLYLPASQLGSLVRDPNDAVAFLAIGRATPKVLKRYADDMLAIKDQWTRGQRRNAGLAVFRLTHHLSGPERSRLALASAEYATAIAETGMLDAATARRVFRTFTSDLRREVGISDDPDIWDDEEYEDVSDLASSQITFLGSMRHSLKGVDLVTALEGILLAAFDLEASDPWSELDIDGNHLERAIREAPDAVLNSDILMHNGNDDLVVMLTEWAEGHPERAERVVAGFRYGPNEAAYQLYHDWISTSEFDEWVEGKLTAAELVNNEEPTPAVGMMVRTYRTAYGDKAPKEWSKDYGYAQAAHYGKPSESGKLTPAKFHELADAFDRLYGVSSRPGSLGRKLVKAGAANRRLSSRGRGRRRGSRRGGARRSAPRSRFARA